MPKPARKRQRSPDKDDGPRNKRNRPSSGDGDKTSSEPTTKSSPSPSTYTSSNPIGVTKSINPTAKTAHNLPGLPTTSAQLAASSFFDLTGPLSATYPSPTIPPSTPTSSTKPFPNSAAPIHPSSTQTTPLTIQPPTPAPQRGRKRRPRATTPPETYTNNLPLVSIVQPHPPRAATGYRRGHPYWLINGVRRLTTPILESVDALLEAETSDREGDEAWNATLERAVRGVAWRDLLGEPPSFIREILREREREEARKGKGGNAEGAAGGDIPIKGEQGEDVKEGGDVDTDDGEVIGRWVGAQSYVDASCPKRVAGPLIDGGVVAQHDDAGLVVEATRTEQAGGQSGEPRQASGERPGGSGRASVGQAEAVRRPGTVRQSSLAPIVDPPRDLPGWVDYEARLVDPKYF